MKRSNFRPRPESSYRSLLVLWIACVWMGFALPIIARTAHPKGPENRPSHEHVFLFQGDEQQLQFSMNYPDPDDTCDKTRAGRYCVQGAYPVALFLYYEYRGFFWQGEFGGVHLELEVITREPSSTVWTDMDALLKGIEVRSSLLTEKARHNPPDIRKEWQKPTLSSLNGAPVVLQFVHYGSDPTGIWLYFVPIDSGHALCISIEFVDNSSRPGLPPSDWRPRAEALAKGILSTVRVHYEPSQAPKAQ